MLLTWRITKTMTDKQYRDLVKRIEEAKRWGDEKEARKLNQELWDRLSAEEIF